MFMLAVQQSIGSSSHDVFGPLLMFTAISFSPVSQRLTYRDMPEQPIDVVMPMSTENSDSSSGRADILFDTVLLEQGKVWATWGTKLDRVLCVDIFSRSARSLEGRSL